MWHRRPRGGAGSGALRSAPLRSGRPLFPRICSWSPSSHSLNPGDRSLQPGRGGADRKDAIRASAMEAPALSLTEEDLTEVKKDVSSSAGLGAAGRAGMEESGNPEPSDGELRIGRTQGRGTQHDPPAASRGWLEVTQQPAVSPRGSLLAPAWVFLCHPLHTGGSAPLHPADPPP